ncbi:hypothetical protein RN001_015689 [Aquatica leii]|uniref:Uncharacterized protein n=1 Tax=Aquatica leii TaxID=1421715 RepID=A0AAN7PXM8_9COLE|nr:hypothetical protein RN001_015689 [Aquatica leii]
MRYGDAHLQQVYQAQIKSRVQKAAESLQEFEADIARLTRLAYPTAPDTFLEQLAIQTFIEMKWKEKKEKELRKRKRQVVTNDIFKRKNKILHKNVSYNEDEDDEDELSLHDDSDDDVETHVWIPEVEPSGFEELDKDPDPNDFVLVQFNAKKEIVFYVGKVVQTENLKNEIEVIFLRKARKFTGHFVFPNVPDISMVSTEDIKMI